MSNYLLTFAAVILYCAATVRLIYSLTRRPQEQTHASTSRTAHNRYKKARLLPLILAALALLPHAYIAYVESGLPYALNLPFFTALSVMGLTIVTIQLAMCVIQPADYLGIAIYPVAAISLCISQVSGQSSSVLPSSIEIHVLLSIIAYAVLAIAAAQASLVAVQRHYLNLHKPGGFMRQLPALTSTESLLFTLLSAGFILLTLSLVSGFVYLEDMFAQHLVHKTILSCLAWLIFAVLLLGRWRFGWRGKRAVHWTLGGFVMLLLAYFGSKLVLELILKQG